ncbi:MAG TPA: DUF853 family protein [bacterium]|nr:DUF853 family protein [bacterium]
MKKEITQIKVGDLLAQFDQATLYMLERRYLSEKVWMNISDEFFSASNTRNDLKESFHGFQLSGMNYYSDIDRGLSPHNMELMLSLFRDGTHNFLYLIDSAGKANPEISMMSVRNLKKKMSISTSEYGKLLSRGLQANFPGAINRKIDFKDYVVVTKKLREYKNISVMTGIPARKKTEEKFFLQGMDRFLDCVAGLDFSCLIVAEPYTTNEIVSFIDPVLSLKSEISQFKKFTKTKSESLSETVMKTITIGGSGSVSSSQTTSTTKLGGGGVAMASSGPGAIVGAKLGAVIGSAWPAVGTAIGAVAGGAIGALAGPVVAFAKGMTLASTISDTISKGGSLFGSYSHSYGKTHTEGESLSTEVINASAEFADKLVEQNIERLKLARAFGYWNVGVYFFAKDSSTMTAVKNAANAIFSGESSWVEPIRFVDISIKKNLSDKSFINEVLAGYNPKLKAFDELQDELKKELKTDNLPLSECYNSLATKMTTNELAIMTAPPQRECRALSVTQKGTFGGKALDTQNHNNKTNEKDMFSIGEVLYYGNPTNENISIPLSDLNRHAFVTGITGSGKTNTVKGWCHQLSEKGVQWMVIEPSSKKEYRHLVANDVDNPIVFSLGTEKDAVPFRFNPFYFPKNTNVLTHIDRLKTAFSASFPMYASMPYILEEAIVEIYEDLGWNLSNSSNSHTADPWNIKMQPFIFPNLSDLHDKINSVVLKKGYDIRLQMDISAALRARIGSLLIGSKGRMLNTSVSIDMAELQKRNVVIEMAEMGSDDEKCLIMALLIISLYENAGEVSVDGKKPLKHILVIEEAHRLLRNAASSDNPEIANIRGSAVEHFSNMLAEMRAFGQGVIIVDQTPSKLIPDAIKNTAFKCVHQLCAADDRKVVGESMILDEVQQNELSRLKPNKGEAVLYHQSWEKAYGIKIKWFDHDTNHTVDKIEKQKAEFIKENPAVYAENNSRYYPDEIKIKAHRAVIGFFTNDIDLFKQGIKSRSNIISKKDTNYTLHCLLFNEVLKDLFRLGCAKANLLSECPERFLNLLNEAEKSYSVNDQLLKLYRELLQNLKNTDKREASLAKAAINNYVIKTDLSQVIEKIKASGDFGEDAYESLNKSTKKHLDQICPIKENGEDIDEGNRRYLHRILIEQMLLLSGIQNKTFVVEQYSRRFI